MHLNDLIVGIIGGIGIIREIRAKKKSPLFGPITWWVGAMAISLFVNIGNYPLSQLTVAAMYAFRWVAYAGMFFFLGDLSPSTSLRVSLAHSLKAIVLIVAVVGIFQYLLMPNASWLATANWDEHYFRLISTFLDPGFAGIILVLGLIFFIFHFKFLIDFSFIYFSIVYTALLLTYSRASYLAYLTGFAAIAYYKKSLKIIVLAALLLVLTIPLLPKTFGEGTKLARESSIRARINNWKQAVTVWQRAPLFGVGFDAYRYSTGASLESHAGAGADSSLLLVLATTGVVGLIAYLGVLRGMWVMGRKNLVFKASFLAVFIHSWFNNTLFYPWVMEWLWLLLILSKQNFRPGPRPSP